MLLLLGTCVFALALALLNWFLFIRNEAPSTVENPPRAASFSREKLDEVLASFETRKAKYDSALRTLPLVADPGK
ncbi:MAG: hypothetical protein G01um101417_161 [Parcubacteria group bacterium Gr01-1014_17]|nr:MAG: hypothetical protein G01um101417_161 [Parcubacteria group bacterium Gr01-1014_17]